MKIDLVSKTITYRDAALNHIKLNVKGFKSYLTHAARFDGEKGLKKFMASPPACRVAVLGGFDTGPASDGRYYCSFDMAAFVVAAKVGAHSQEFVGMHFCEAIFTKIYAQQFGIKEAELPENIRITEVHNEANIVIMAVTWRVRILLGDAIDFNDGLEFDEDAILSVTGASND